MMLQDIYPHSLHNQFTEKSDPLPESPVYVFRRADLLVVESREDARLEDIDQSGEHGKISMPGKDENEKGFYKERGRYLRLPTVKELGEDREYTFLFTMDGSAFFLLRDELDDADIPQPVCGDHRIPALQLVPGQSLLRYLRQPHCPFRDRTRRPLPFLREDDLSPYHSRGHRGCHQWR